MEIKNKKVDNNNLKKVEKNKIKQMLINHLEIELNSYNYSDEQQENIKAAIKLVKSIKIGGKN